MRKYEVPQPILNSPYDEPAAHWHLHNGQPHGSVVHLILETKGYDPLKEIKSQAARRWVDAVNAEGSFGRWDYAVAESVFEIPLILERAAFRPAVTR